MDTDHHSNHEHADVPVGAKTATDPVCGMQVALDAGKPAAQYQGQGFHFCSDKCHGKFAANP